MTFEGLISENPYRDKTLVFVLVYDKEEMIAFGHACQHPQKRHRFYLSTIYVTEAYRQKGISNFVLQKLIMAGINNTPSFSEFEAVTQPENNAAIHLLDKMGFTYSADK